MDNVADVPGRKGPNVQGGGGRALEAGHNRSLTLASRKAYPGFHELIRSSRAASKSLNETTDEHGRTQMNMEREKPRSTRRKREGLEFGCGYAALCSLWFHFVQWNKLHEWRIAKRGGHCVAGDV